jgi:hypothetical protein
MQNISKAQQVKAEKTLNTLVRYSEGVMTRKQWINLMRIKGATVEESTTNRIRYNRIKYNRMSSQREQDEYMKKCDEMVICYNLLIPNQNSFWQITKTEYDYFNSIQVSEDIMTEKHDLENRIEAGIATEAEIQDDQDKETEFFTKYFS